LDVPFGLIVALGAPIAFALAAGLTSVEIIFAGTGYASGALLLGLAVDFAAEFVELELASRGPVAVYFAPRRFAAFEPTASFSGTTRAAIEAGSSAAEDILLSCFEEGCSAI
jgi:hypothetical protein